MSELFANLKLDPNILRGITELGYVKPTPVQGESIPHILAGKDVIAMAQTGTGKTAAFVLPTLHRLLNSPRKQATGIRALILAPTRELALQSMGQLESLSRYVPLRGVAIFGGVPMQPQIRALEQGVDIVSATPGRLLDHVYEGRMDFGALEIFVLDEADRMMDMGFMPDIQRIISFLPPQRQNLIFSATIPDEIMKLARDMCHDPVTVKISVQSTVPAGIRHAIYPVSDNQKNDLLLRLVSKHKDMSSVIVFTRTKSGAERLAKVLQRAGIKISVIHGDRSQGERLRALDYFKEGKSQILVATDVAARGIDVKDISHVINFDMPQTPEDYIHRVGRTARAETTGDAFSFVTPEDEELVKEIERVMNEAIPRVLLPDFNYRKSSLEFTGRSRSSHSAGPGGHRPHGGHGHARPAHGRHPGSGPRRPKGR